MAAIASNESPLMLSSDAGVTWKTLICLTSTGASMTRDVTTTETFCGISTSLGNAQVAVPFEAIADTAPTGTQVSFKDMLGWFNAGTLINWKIEHGTLGADYHMTGQGYVTSLELVAQSGESVQFSGELQLQGALDITP